MSKTEFAITANDFACLFVALLAVAATAVLLLSYSYKEETLFSQVSHTREIFRDSQQILVTSARADTSVRNYLLTKNAKYLDEYKTSKAELIHEVAALITSSKRPITRFFEQTMLWPNLNAFIAASDLAVAQNTIDFRVLQKQENARIALDSTLDKLEQRQLTLLQKRNDTLAMVSENIASTRLGVVLIALLAITFSVITLQSVMRKDKMRIEELEAEVKRTTVAEQIASDALAEACKSNELKAEFMSNISHEIRTPMTGVLGTAELLNEQELPPAAKDGVTLLLRSSRELLAVLNDLLDFSKMQRQEVTLIKEPFALRRTIDEVVKRASLSAGNRIENLAVTTIVDPLVPSIVVADEEKIRQVLQALLSNAFKFTENGSVEICVDYFGNKQVRIAVCDTGIGIDTEGQKKLFLPFVQVDGGIRRLYSGAGLSLYLAKRYVQMMSGQIGVLSEPGQGSIFWFSFSSGEINEHV